MTLVKTKSKKSSSARKLNAGHHRKNKNYLKTYWPYIPLLLILGGSVVASHMLPVSLSGSTSANYTTRAEALIGYNSFMLLAGLYILLVILSSWYVVRHIKRIKRLIKDSEQVLARHYALDVLIGLMIGSLYILVR